MKQKGFTLVELAIVLMIIGLLIGGILKGQELIQNARVTSLIRQVKNFEAATYAFKDSYGTLPGDLVSPSTRLPNCSAAPCTTTGNANGIIEPAPAATSLGIGGGANSAQSMQTLAETGERVNYWVHLAKANLISGINPDMALGQPIVWGNQVPESPFAGSGYIVGGTISMTSAIYEPTMRGNMMFLVAKASSTPPFSTRIAAQVDRKMDDGLPFTGDIAIPINGASAASTCVATQTRTSVYNEGADSGGCALVFKLPD